MSPRPRLHLLVLTPTLVLTVAASGYPASFNSLRRDPQALLRGEVWRLLSPALIQADALQEGRWWRMVVVLVMVLWSSSSESGPSGPGGACFYMVWARS